MKNSEKLNYLVSHASADINLCAAAYSVISEAASEEQGQLLKEFIIGYKQTPSDGKLDLPVIMENEEEHRFMRRYGKIVDGYLEDLQEKSPSEAQFYDELWKYIQYAPELTSKKIRVFALFDIVIDKRVPYIQIDRSSMLSMDNDEFRALNRQVGEERFAKLEYILNGSFEQQTQRASLVVKILEEIPDFKLKTVFMARLIAHFSRKLDRMRLAELMHRDDD